MINETKFVKALRGNLTGVCKIKNYKMVADSHRGLPDIYVAGGNWIECKEVVYKATRPFSLMSHISPSQRATLEELTVAGDNAFVAFALTLRGDHFWLLMNWKKFKCMNLFDAACVEGLGFRWDWKAMPELIRWFRPGIPRNYDMEAAQQRFTTFLAKCDKDRRFYTPTEIDWRNLPSSLPE